MRIKRIIKSTRYLLLLNKLRLILSVAGIAVGITAVIIMISLGEGARIKMLSQIEMMGSNLITIDAGKIKNIVGRKRETAKVTTLKIKDAKAISESEITGIKSVVPTQEQTLLVKYGDGTTNTRIIATTSGYPAIRNYKIESGRFFDSTEDKMSKRVAIVGQKIVTSLFNYVDPVGETIKINKVPFEIIGVLKPKGVSYDGANEDDVIFIPLNSGMRRVFNVDYIKNIYVRVSNKDKILHAENELKKILRERHRLHIRNKENDFTIQNVYTAIKAVSKTNESFNLLIISVAALSLLVGGIGIFAVMLLSIRERRSEIGLRMAVGAKQKDILFQFLTEAVILSIAGGITGIFTGITGSYLIDLMTDFTTKISLQPIIFSALISIGIGIFFGVFPALRASRLEPVKALAE